MWDGVNLVSIIPHGQNVLRGHGGSQVRRLELRFWRSSGSVLGPVLFSAFVSPISRIMESHGIMYHQYADDTQLYTEVRSLVPSEMEALAQCVSALTFWFLDNGLQLNSSKSEAMILGSRQGLSRMEPVGSLVIGDDRVEVRDDIKILGVHLDPTLSMNAQVKAVIKASNFHIRALRHVRRGLTLESTKMIALGLVTSRLDYCNSLLYGTSKTNTAKLQRVQNDLARVVLRAAWNSSSKPLLKQLHWLPVQQRITFKIALITFNVRSSEQPSYLHSLLDNYTPSRNLRSGGTASPPSSIPKIGCRQTQLLLRRADHLEQSQLINKGGYLNRNIQDTPQDRTVFLGLSMNTHRPPPLHQNRLRTIIYCSLLKHCK